MVAPLQLAKEHVPMLIHVVMILWDNYTPLVQDQAHEMLVHLIHELVISKMAEGADMEFKKSIEELIDQVRRHDPRVVWVYEESNRASEDDDGQRIPAGMNYLANEVVKVFSVAYPTIQQDWARTALLWATSCQIRHLACRSFQIFRCIPTPMGPTMLGDMLARLQNTIAADDIDVQTFSMEILTTLKTIIEALSTDELMQYPQLFWIVCACLDTVHEREFQETCIILDLLLEKIDFDHPTQVARLVEKRPPLWVGDFEGIQPLLYKGIRSSVCMEHALKLMQLLVVLPSNELLGDDSRLAFTLLANLPRFLQSFNQELKDPALITAAETLAAVAQDQNATDLAEVLSDFASGRFRLEMDFLSQVISAIREFFFPELEYSIVIFLLGLVTNSVPWFKIMVMKILCVLIPDVDMRKPEFMNKGPDLISPLLRLLQTEFCPQALDVLDNVMVMTGTPLEKHHLRMSMAGSHSSKAFRKEYDKVQSLYGIPEASGWSIPTPAMHSANTRSNVEAVWQTFEGIESLATTRQPTPKVELLIDEYPASSYFPDYRTATMTSSGTRDARDDGAMGELVQKLDSLDDFFDDDDVEDHRSDSPASPAPTRFNPVPYETREHLYDQQTAPILNRSLKRNPSVNSFAGGFAEVRIPIVRDPAVMSPTAFTAPSSTSLPTSAHSQPTNSPRPGLMTRSHTSPIWHVHARSTPDASGSMPEEIDEPFSDDDTGSGGTRSEKSFSLETMMHPFQRSKGGGFRQGIRRLTGGGDSKERERAREAIRAAQRSPVPKIPQNFLIKDPKSADP